MCGRWFWPVRSGYRRPPAPCSTAVPSSPGSAAARPPSSPPRPPPGWAAGSWSAACSRAGVYRQDLGEVVPWLLVVFTATLTALLLATRIPLVSRILADPGMPARLALPHTLRVVGVLFLIVMALGHLPAVFALPAGLGDIAIGVAAPFVARRLARGTGHTGAVRFNVLGILDLVVAVSIAFLLLPSTA